MIVGDTRWISTTYDTRSNNQLAHLRVGTTDSMKVRTAAVHGFTNMLFDVNAAANFSAVAMVEGF